MLHARQASDMLIMALKEPSKGDRILHKNLEEIDLYTNCYTGANISCTGVYMYNVSLSSGCRD